MKGRWESNINVWFPFISSQKWNCYFENKIIIFSPSSYTHLSERDYIFPGSVCLLCCSKICGPILGIYKFLTGTWMWNWDWGHAIPRKEIHKSDFHCSVGFSIEAQNMLLTIQNNLQRLLFCGANPFVAVFTVPFKPYIYIYYIILFYLILDSARWAWLSVIAKALIYSLYYMYISTSLLVCSDK